MLMGLFNLPARFFVRWVLNVDAMRLLVVDKAVFAIPNAVATVKIFTVPAGQCWRVCRVEAFGFAGQTYDQLAFAPKGVATEYGILKRQAAGAIMDYEPSFDFVMFEEDAISIQVIASANVGAATIMFKRVY
jgi:hypothetical protein